MYQNILVLVLAAAAAFFIPDTAHATSPAVRQADMAEPFGLIVGKTTLQEAEAKWEAEGAVIINRGYAGIGAGSGVNGMATLSAEKILLIDVADVEFEGRRPARFAFFEETLFSVQTVLRPLLNRGTNVQNLTEQEVFDLEKQIRQRHGQPNHAMRDITAGKKPNVFIWDFGQNTLTLTIGTLYGSTLSYTNTVLAKKAEAYKKKALRVQSRQ